MKNRKTSFVNYCLIPLIAVFIFISCDQNIEMWTFLGELKITPGSATVGTELTVKYSGSEKGVLYSWRTDGGYIDPSTDFRTTKYTPTHPGDYYVTISNTGYKTKKSNTVTVTLNNLGGSVTISPAGPVPLYTELTANYSGTENVSLQWQKNFTNISGATGNKYTPVEFGLYNVTVSALYYAEKKPLLEVSVSNELPCPAYYGTWKSDEFSVIVTVDTLTVYKNSVLNLKITNTTWRGQSSEKDWPYYEDYPQNFMISGNIDPSSSEVGNGRDRMSWVLYLHKTDRQKVLMDIQPNDGYHVFDKQP